ncbi:ABC-type transport system, involved in lipoprotein release, permease component [Mucilaginibacter pineti]|uniref:ABC-type transport system, involved in lipoprotein release, permease component n=1 Tax=Mucilaginibacter pineti TaxID=1391627 RepID=A0A1G6SZ70_9SPHI|nr:ABC transporter permease [Mucilaginibacter pineti]SDD21546.1 ABC-type transport system, involved in lipoprotein release, permease component [Mucilaginibacter pineti]
MLKNYIKIAWRNIVKGKVYSAINILGLAAGMAVALLIGLWVNNEYSFDRFLPNYQQVYQVRRNFNSNGEMLNFTSTSLALGIALKNQIPEIEYVAETNWLSSHGLMVGDKKLIMNGEGVGGDYLKIFEYPLLRGSASNVLKDPYSIVLTQSAAKALFGTDDVINKMVRFDNTNNLKVTGILKDLPANSTIQLSYIMPFSYFEAINPYTRMDKKDASFGNNGYEHFVKLKPGISYEQVAPKIKNIEKVQVNNSNAKNSDVVLQPMQDWHLYTNYINGVASGGFIEYVRIFSVIGLLVLAIACINFINLTTARSEKRAKEVGIRKAIGSYRKHLIFQFLTESILITFIAFLFCILFVQVSLPFFNELTDRNIALPYENPVFWAIILSGVLAIGIIAGSKPAFYLSAFNPVKVLKGTIQVGRSATLSRKVLVVLQFSCSIALIVSTVVIYRQVQYAKDRPTGYNIDRLLMTDNSTDISRNYQALKNDLLQSGLVQNITTASSPATGIYWHNNLDYWPGKNANETVEMGMIRTTAGYFNTLGMKIVAGRNMQTDADTNNVVLNQAAVKRLRLKQPLNQQITINGNKLTIIGVAKDALMDSPFAPADPTTFVYNTNAQDKVIYRLSPNVKTQDAITKLGQIFAKYNPAYPYTYKFVDDEYNRKFSQEVLIGKLSGIFAGLAIFISCLGLFGLAAYVAEQRTKEIGVRKVLGASVSQIWFMLSKDFVLLVMVSCIVATPIALYFLQNWLLKYSYRITIGPGIFIVSAIAAIGITLITISFQAIKAAVANPVKSLRSE